MRLRLARQIVLHIGFGEYEGPVGIIEDDVNALHGIRGHCQGLERVWIYEDSLLCEDLQDAILHFGNPSADVFKYLF